MPSYFVNTGMLNVRSTPDARTDTNIIFRLGWHAFVTLLDNSMPDWWKVRFNAGTGIETSAIMEGYVRAKYLLLAETEPSVLSNIVDVDFPPSPLATLDSKRMMYRPVGDSSIIRRDISNSDSKKASIGQLINKLNVPESIRYARTEKHTFCNIYAYDFCHFCGVYLPRVWWTGKALEQLALGNEVEVLYGQTVNEQNANALYRWLMNWGNRFGWELINDVHTLQEKVNANGGVGLICAQHRNAKESGHIVAVVPETNLYRAYRENGMVRYPLQSQAGAFNFKYFSNERRAWWLRDKFTAFGLFYHE